jgi:hypothetical protein
LRSSRCAALSPRSRTERIPVSTVVTVVRAECLEALTPQSSTRKPFLDNTACSAVSFDSFLASWPVCTKALDQALRKPSYSSIRIETRLS